MRSSRWTNMHKKGSSYCSEIPSVNWDSFQVYMDLVSSSISKLNVAQPPGVICRKSFRAEYFVWLYLRSWLWSLHIIPVNENSVEIVNLPRERPGLYLRHKVRKIKIVPNRYGVNSRILTNKALNTAGVYYVCHGEVSWSFPRSSATFTRNIPVSIGNCEPECRRVPRTGVSDWPTPFYWSRQFTLLPVESAYEASAKQPGRSTSGHSKI